MISSILKAISLPFLFLVTILSVTAADHALSAGPEFKAWDKPEFIQKYVECVKNQNLPLLGLMMPYMKGVGLDQKPKLTIIKIRGHMRAQKWTDLMPPESIANAGEEGTSNTFAAAHFFLKALPLYVKNDSMRTKLVEFIRTLLNPDGSYEPDLKRRPQTRAERDISFAGTLWIAMEDYRKNPSLTYDVAFWNAYFTLHYRSLAGGLTPVPTLNTMATAAAMVSFYMSGKKDMEAIQKDSRMEPSLFASLQNEIWQTVQNNTPLQAELESLRGASESKGASGLQRPSAYALTGATLPPLFLGEKPTSGSVTAVVPGSDDVLLSDVVVDVDAVGPDTHLLRQQRDVSCWRKYGRRLLCGTCVVVVAAGGTLLTLDLTKHLGNSH